MNPIFVFGCRAFQTAFRMALPFLPYREPAILHSCGELGTVFQKEHTKSVLIVTDRGIVESGLAARVEEAVRNSGVSYAIYDKTQPNPTVDNVEEMNDRMGIPTKLTGICREDIPTMARHAAREANPLYPVPKRMTRAELEEFYCQIADWSEGK